MNQQDIKSLIEQTVPSQELISSWNDGSHSEERTERFGTMALTGFKLKISLRVWKNKKGLVNRKGGKKPAEMAFFEDGTPYYLCWIKEGKQNYEAPVSYVEWDKDGEIVMLQLLHEGKALSVRRDRKNNETSYSAHFD